MPTTVVAHSLSGLKHQIRGTIDVFICCASFEERCLSVARNLAVKNVKRAIIARNQTNGDVIGANVETLMRIFGNASECVVVNAGDPLQTEDAMLAMSSELPTAGRIVIDITTFTHESVLILMHALLVNLQSGCTLDFVYASAEEYSVGDASEYKWLSKGIREVRTVVGFPGNPRPSRGTHLIILAGFEDFRAYRIIDELEPTAISIGYGDHSENGTIPHQATNEAKVRRLRTLVGDANIFEFSCYDPRLTADKLCEIRSSVVGMNTVVAPMNTKVSTLGAALFASENCDSQLCYVQPDIYNYDRYSRPGDSVYVYKNADVGFSYGCQVSTGSPRL